MTASTPKDILRIAAIGDLHYSRNARGSLASLFGRISESADVLLLCGDLTDYGLPEEAEILASDLHGALRVPAIAVLGNHDFESGKADEVHRIFMDAGVTVLDGDTCELYGVGFTGVKGFAGGFGRAALQSWGEPAIKTFVQEAVSEELKLEKGLAKLGTPKRVVLLHYAPVAATLQGENPEIFAFLGSSRLEEPLSRYPLSAVFHGHAHGGQAEGHLRGGAPVYNVAIPLLQRLFPDRPPFRLVEIPTSGGSDSSPSEY
jgi:Icc-related predicted phosphoesterase